MKELSIEEKAKRYDEAKLRMSTAYNSNRCTIGFMNEIFPELAESEDERIRKAIINVFSSHADYEIFFGVSVKDILSWLEKQQKPIKEHDACDFCEDRYGCVSPCPTKLIEEEKHDVAFKVGDYIICRNGEDVLYQITDSIPTGYMIKGDDGIIHSVTFEQLINCNAILCVIQKQKPAWSEEDDMHFRRCLGYIEAYVTPRKDDVNWLKSLKSRYTWKPSDEQMKALGIAIRSGIQLGTWEEDALKSLAEQLKKLRG